MNRLELKLKLARTGDGMMKGEFELTYRKENINFGSLDSASLPPERF